MEFNHVFPSQVASDECAYIKVNSGTTTGSGGTPTTGAYESFFFECRNSAGGLIGTITILDGLTFPNSINATTNWWIPKNTKSLRFYVRENSNRLDLPNNACTSGSIFIGSSAWRYKVEITGP
jgi:hypothetical protein